MNTEPRRQELKQMSFSHAVKAEIIGHKPRRARRKTALAHGLFLFASSFSGREVALRTEHRPTAELYASLLRDFAGKTAEVDFTERVRGGRAVYTVRLAQPEDRLILLQRFGYTVEDPCGSLSVPEDISAFLAGAFLACGSVSDPQKGYHLEFAVGDEALCIQLCALLEEYLSPPKRTVRRKGHVAYYKESAQIEDLITAMGASKSCLALIEVEIVKTVRNKANRVTNCETANIDKTVSAAAAQIEDIRLVLAHCRENDLPARLLEAARLRLENPEMSLRELVRAHGSISRSGMHHRLEKLSNMAEQIRGKQKGEDLHA